MINTRWKKYRISFKCKDGKWRVCDVAADTTRNMIEAGVRQMRAWGHEAGDWRTLYPHTEQ